MARLAPAHLMRAMGEHLEPAQAAMVESVWANRETYVPSCHAAGKTFTEARVVVAWTLAHWPDVLTVVLTPTEDQLTAGIWRELQSMWDVDKPWSRVLPGHLGVKQWTQDEMGVLAIGRSPRPERPGSLQGLHSPNLLLVVDEAPEVDPRLWKAARSLLTGGNTRLLAAGNPTRSDGDFYARTLAPKGGDNVITVCAFETANLADVPPELHAAAHEAWPTPPELQEWLEARMERPLAHTGLIDARYVIGVLTDGVRGEWQARVLAEFPDATDDTLIPRAWVERARTNVLWDGDDGPWPLVAGVDIAAFGDDRCVLMPRRGGCVLEPLVWRGVRLTETAGRIQDWMRGKRVSSITVDEGGMGLGVVHMLYEQGIAAAEVDHNARPEDERFENHRSEYWWGMREAFERGEVDLSRLSPRTFAELTEELTAVRYTLTSKGKRKVEPKPDTKKRLRRSPDLADALVYSFIPAPAFDAFVGSSF